jgi:gamma-glutamyl-gamma-aminobutyrate hydrolase PuuD
MANYNTRVVKTTKHSKTLLVTSSARKAAKQLTPGVRVEVWSENRKVDTIYTRTGSGIQWYIEQEREYLRAKQAAAEKRNRKRRARRDRPI